MIILEDVKQQIIELIRKTTEVEISPDELKAPPDSKFGDLSLACFGLAKTFTRSAEEVAKKIEEAINHELKIIKEEQRLISRVKAFGPYLNFFLNRNAIIENILNNILKQKKRYGELKMGRGKKIMIEYSSPNTHKEFHIGHLRNACLGLALVNLYKASGYKVISANYPGDVGAHVAQYLWYFAKLKIKKVAFGDIYKAAVKTLEEHPEYKIEVAEVERKLEAGDKKLIALWKKTRKQSLEEFKKIYKELGIKFDVWFFESEMEKEGKKLIPELLKKGIARMSEGAVIADLKDYNLDVLVLLRADGTALYSTKDIPLAIKKFKKYKIDESYYVVDVRQTLYLKQIFKILELLGFHQKMVHIPYEFVTLPEGSMASRYGRVVTYANLRDEAVRKSIEETKKRHPDWKGKKIEEVARKIALSAMKFEMLKRENKEVIVFRLDEALQFEGFTGPYLLYTVARINSIFKKSKVKSKKSKGINFKLLKEPIEVMLTKKLGEFPEIIGRVVKTNEPSELARYLFELAQDFNTFYHELPVLKAETNLREARLTLINLVKGVLEKGLGLLGIKTIIEM